MVGVDFIKIEFSDKNWDFVSVCSASRKSFFGCPCSPSPSTVWSEDWLCAKVRRSFSMHSIPRVEYYVKHWHDFVCVSKSLGCQIMTLDSYLIISHFPTLALTSSCMKPSKCQLDAPGDLHWGQTTRCPRRKSPFELHHTGMHVV